MLEKLRLAKSNASLGTKANLSMKNSFPIQVLTLLLAFSWASTTLAAPFIHVVMVVDSNAKDVGEFIKQDAALINSTFVNNVPQGQFHFYELKGNSASIEGIETQFENMHIDSDDTVVFIYTGHGAFDVNTKQHLMTLDNDEIIRRDSIRKFLLAHDQRTTVLLTNSCSNFVDVFGNSPDRPKPTQISPLFDQLFLQTKGVVDISATSPGEFGITGGIGSEFIIALYGSLEHSNRRVGWSTIIKEINHEIKTRPRYEEANQTAYAVLPLPGQQAPEKRPVVQKRWTGAYVKQNAGGGVIVIQVIPNTPAMRIRDKNGTTYRLVPNRDVITHVNGLAVNTAAAFEQEIHDAGKVAAIKVYDGKLRTYATYYVDTIGR